jgi:hypothetical protein
MCNQVEGFKNSFTHTFCLWVDNNENLYLNAMAMTGEALGAVGDDQRFIDGIWNFEQIWKFLLEDELERYWAIEQEEWQGSQLRDNVFVQLAQDALGHVVWREVAEHFISKYKDTWGYRDE